MADVKISALPAATPLTGTEEVPGVQDNATKRMTTAAIASLAPIQDHGQLVGLTDDDHPQYQNNARGDARYPPLARLITNGDGIAGGGDLTADRTLSVVYKAQGGVVVTSGGVAVDIIGMNLLGEAVDATNDMLIIYNASGGNHRRVSVADALAGGSGFVATSRVIGDGAGLTGGGDLTSDRTLAVGAGTGITVNANDVQLDLAHVRNVDHSGVSINAGTGLSGGGNITASRTLQLDTTSSRNVDHSAVSVTGVTSLTGGGDLTASRTLNLVGDVASPGATFYYGTNSAGVKSFYPITSVSIAWSQITGTKNADQLQGNAASAFASASHNHDASYVGINSNGQLNSLGVGVAASGSAGSIRATGDISGFFTSDVRFKENVRQMHDALEIISEIRGVRFDWTEDYLKRNGGPDGYFNRKHDIGVIAQEIEKVLPEVVGKRVDGSLAVKYDRLVAVLIEAVKLLDARVLELEQRK